MKTLLLVGLVGFGYLVGSRTPFAAEPIRIGVVLPLSGDGELYGRQAKIGLDLAVREINSSGGILDRPVELIYRDDKSTPDGAGEAARRAIQNDNVVALIGPMVASGLAQVAPIAEKAHMPLLYAGSYEGDRCGRYLFSLNALPSQELDELLRYMTAHFGSSYYLLGSDDNWAHGMFLSAEARIASLGGTVAGKTYVKGDAVDFSPLIDRIAAGKARVLLLAMRYEAARFISQAETYGLFKQITVAYLGLSEAEVSDFAGIGQNMYTVVPFVATSDNPRTAEFVAKVHEQLGYDGSVSHHVATHYTALMAIRAAFEKAGVIDKEKLIDALEGLAIDGPAGRIVIGKNHHTTMPMFVAKTKDRELVPVVALGEIAPQLDCHQ